MRSAVLAVILSLLVVAAAEDKPVSVSAGPASSGAGAKPDKAELAKADEQAQAGLAAMQDSNGNTSRTVDAALCFSSALHIYEAAGETEKAREMQANIFWCKKRMNIDDLQRFVAAKGKDPKVAADLARIEQVVEKKIPTDQADTYLADADRYALEHPDKIFLIAVRYFEVAERFVGTPASLKAQRKSLDYQAKVAPTTASPGDTVFTRPTKPAQGLQPLPSAADQKAAKEAVRKLYKDDFAERKDSVRRAFAWRLYEQAKASKDDIKMRHALLSEATQLAVSTRDVAGIIAFTDELAGGFEGVDASAEKKAQLLKIKSDPGAVAVLKLLDDPRDAAANAVAGKYFCLTAEKWDIGLPLLALGNDATLAKIATMEAAKPSSAPQQMELADAWFAQGNGRNEQGVAAWTRAMMWYKQAQPKLTGVSKERVEQNLESMFPAVVDPTFKWDAISEKQWDKLKGTLVTVNCLKEKQDTGVMLHEGQRARVVPHPTDTWIFQAWWTESSQALTWRGSKTHAMGMGMASGNGNGLPIGAMAMWLKEGQQKGPGVITGPGEIFLGPVESSYGSKGVIRAKVIMIDD